MQISVAVPNGLMDVSNGKFVGKTDLGDGYTRWDWMVHYPINNYDVALNIGDYVQFSDHLGDLPLDFYVLPEDLEKAKKQFVQAKGMIEAFRIISASIRSPLDGYKLVEVPYSGMEHQSAVSYGNKFTNGDLGRDWTGVGVSMKFDFIIIHESGHEWFGNSITAADRVGHVDSRRLHHVSRMPVRGIHVRLCRRAQVRERLQDRTYRNKETDHCHARDRSPHRRRTCISKAR